MMRLGKIVKYVGLGVLVIVGVYLSVQGVLCNLAVQKANERLKHYQAKTIELDYGKMTYVDEGEGDIILSVHGLFGGYDQAFDNCKAVVAQHRVIAPSRFGYLGSDVLGKGTPKEQAKAYVELLDKLGIDKVYVLGTSAGGTISIRFALDYPERTKGLILYSSTAPSVTKPESVPKPVGPPSFMMNNYCMWLFKPFISQVMGMDSSTVDMILPINKREEGATLDLYGNNIDMQKHFDDYPIESLKVPTLIFEAKDDQLAKYESIKAAVSRFPNCTFVVFETGGHLLVGNEESLNKHLRSFLVR